MPTSRDEIEAVLAEHPGRSIDEIRALLAHIKPKTIEFTLWDMVRRKTVLRSPGGPPRPGVRYTYRLADDDEEEAWSPQPWRHPYAKGAAVMGGRYG